MTLFHSVARFGLLVLGGLALAGTASCNSSGSELRSAECSSCQYAYTLEQCQRWGGRAGCKSATVTQENTCAAGIAGCAFTECKGGPICDDAGEAMCGSCSGDFTQADCDGLATPPLCSTAVTIKLQACGHDAVGCSFSGCNFQPACQ